MSQSIRISEIFGPTIQGEGALIGQPTVFVRTGGCDYRCSWCDTLHAVDSQYRHEWQEMTADAVFTEIRRLTGNTPMLVTLSGGNPAIQPLGTLIAMGLMKDYRFALETQGSIAQEWFSDLHVLTLSPKPPSSGHETDWDAFDQCLKMAGKRPRTSLKIVVKDEADYQYARDTAARYPQLPVYLQPANTILPPAAPDHDALMERMRWLVDRATSDRWHNVTILPQLHVMIWGNKRGV